MNENHLDQQSVHTNDTIMDTIGRKYLKILLRYIRNISREFLFL